jgi:hypothetical protein
MNDDGIVKLRSRALDYAPIVFPETGSSGMHYGHLYTLLFKGS